MAANETTERKWGRVAIVGGIDWIRLGRKETKGAKAEPSEPIPDITSPTILRSLSNVKIVSINTSHSGCHFIVLSLEGDAYLFGRNTSGALGIPSTTKFVPETSPIRLKPTDVGAQAGTLFVAAACGRSHSLLVTSDGQVYAAGANAFGQCGQGPVSERPAFKPVTGPWKSGSSEPDKAVQAAAGLTFSLVLTESGKVYSFGSGEKGQLGNGRTGEHIATGNRTAFDVVSDPAPIRGLEGKRIVQISAGQQHSIILDDEGLVYVFGFNGYCRLGLGHQKDVLVPTAVPHFSGDNRITRGSLVAAGPTNSIVVDKQRMHYLAGKWKNSGDGSTGQPYTSFRYLPDIMTCKISFATSGGVTHWALCPADEDQNKVMTVAWGQNANNYELGFGPDEPKSATKPQRVITLNDVDVFDIAAGQNTTMFLFTPGGAELPRHPEDVDHPELCVVCSQDLGEDELELECEKCDAPYHLKCLSPPLGEVPEGEWFCPQCDLEATAEDIKLATKKGGGRKRKASTSKDDPDGMSDVVAAPKRKR